MFGFNSENYLHQGAPPR